MLKGIFRRESDGHLFLARPHRLGAALHQENLAGAIDSPLNILRAAVEALDSTPYVPEGSDLIIVEARSLAKSRGNFDLLDASARGRQVLNMFIGDRTHGDFTGNFGNHEAI